jgi:putative peptide zinc metalloprotease protein
MADVPQTFSESWYRVASQRISVRAHVQMQRQFFRGEKWYVLCDPFNNQFFRIRPAAYEFVSRLNRRRTVQEVWDECLELFADDAPGQEEVIRLLAQLYHANLLQYELSRDSRQLFDRYKKRRQREIRGYLLSIMFARFPLFDPDAFLKRTMPFAKLLMGPLGVIVWLTVIGYSGKLLIDNFDAVQQQTEGLLAPGNLVMLYAGLIILKIFHEFGHAYVCRYFGGEVHVMGVMLLVFTPIPYMDATSSWAFRNRWHRMLVAAAGMIVEIFVAAVAVVIWAKTDGGALHGLAYNMMITASVSTVIFNINPLLRFDGYYILSDLIDIPNLHGQAAKQMLYITEKFAFGCRNAKTATTSIFEALFLYVYWVASRIYRVIVFGGILLIVADMFLLLGLIMLIICGISWVIVPVGRLFKYLASSPKLDRTRLRAISVVVSTAVLLILLLQVIPYPVRFRAPGVLQAKQFTVVINESAGYITEVLAEPGQKVKLGDPLVRLADPELKFEFKAAHAQRSEARIMRRRAMEMEPADIQPLSERLEAIEKRIEQLQQRQDTLIVRARQDGEWIAPRLHDQIGRWLHRGVMLGQIIDDSAFVFRAVVNRREESQLSSDEIRDIEIRFPGQAGTRIPIDLAAFQVIPAAQTTLPSAALGWTGGGTIAVDLSDPSGMRTTELFFEIRADVPNADAALLHGRAGSMRLELPGKPILSQCIRRLRQLLQERYQI